MLALVYLFFLSTRSRGVEGVGDGYKGMQTPMVRPGQVR